MARKKHARPAGAEDLLLSRSASAEYFSDRLRTRKRKTIVTSILAALAVVVVGATIATAAFLNDINTKITGSVNQNLLGELKPQEAGKPFYLLLIGIDKDEGRINDPSYGKEDSGYRSDSIMLTRIDPSEKKVTMVSIHRDTLYDFGEHGQQKINAAYTIGQEAFMGTSFRWVKTGSGCQQIESRAFADCKNLVGIFLPGNVTFQKDTFAGSKQLVIYAPAGGTTQKLAHQYGIPFVNWQ